MNDDISPKYLMKLIADIETALWDLFPSSKYKNVRFYIEKWHQHEEGYSLNDYRENFTIYLTNNNNIDLTKTLNGIDGETLLKIAIDLGVETPDFIPAIPVFRNVIKAEHKSASKTFENAFKKIESEPDIAIGLANSALESIIKEILKDERINSKIKPGKTLYALASELLKVFRFLPQSNMPKEIKTIGSSLLAIGKSIEKLRSENTDFHGKTNDDYEIDEPILTYFVVNSVTTVGLFLNSFYKAKFLKDNEVERLDVSEDYNELPF